MLEDRVAEMLAARGFRLDSETISALIERFGVKTVDDIDSDFIDIIMGMLEEAPPHEEEVPQFAATGISLRERFDHINQMVSNQVEKETDGVINRYKNIPLEVKQKLMAFLQKEIVDNPIDSVEKFKEKTDYYSLTLVESIESKKVILAIMGVSTLLIMVLVFLSMMGNLIHDTSNTDRTRTENVSS